MAGYAIVFSTTRGYMPGTNGFLNALEHYGMADDVDVYVIMVNFDLAQEYKDLWPDVNFEPLDPSFWHESKNAGWYCRLAPPARGIQLLDQYDVVMLAGADWCPVSNFTDRFKLVLDTQECLLSTNEQGCASFDRMTPKGEHPYGHTWMIPWADIPAIMSKNQKQVLELVLDFHRREDCRLSWMDALNYAIRDFDQKPNVEPGPLWVFNLSSQGKVVRDGDKLYYNEERMNGFHRKYWNISMCKKYLAPNSPICQHNHYIFNQMWNFFNRDCRVEWLEGLELWDGKK